MTSDSHFTDSHSTDSVDLELIEAEIAARRLRLKFPQIIEAMFQRDTAPNRINTTITTAFIAVILYDVFLVVDWQTLHDRFYTLVVLRLFVFTPIVGVTIFLCNRMRSAKLAEWSGAISGILAILLPTTTMVFSHSPDRLSYQFGSVLVMMYVSAIQRARFFQSCVGLFAMFGIQSIDTYFSDVFTTPTYINNTIFFAMTVVLLVLNSYLLERDDRRVFLLALRGRLLNEQIIKRARRDALTGLFNRKYLAEVTNEIWANAVLDPCHVAVIMIDIDHFKMFNDSQGHLKGDECLCSISAAILSATTGRHALTFRFGGEEMLVVLPSGDLDGAKSVATAIRAAIANCAIPHPAVGEQAIVTASFGVAGAEVPGVGMSDLIAAADAALYAAKHAGRDCLSVNGEVRDMLDPENRGAPTPEVKRRA